MRDPDDRNGKTEDTKPLIAAYVNENHAMIDQILQRALDKKWVKEFLGPQVKTKQAALQELDAIWMAVQSMGLRYSSISRVGTEVKGIKSQNIRFLDEAIRNKQANCVDGSVLFASILMRIGLNPQLMFYPNHCQVAVNLPRIGDIVIETTMLGTGADVADAMEAATKRLEKVVNRFGKSEGYYGIDIRDARNAGIQPLRFRRGAAAR